MISNQMLGILALLQGLQVPFLAYFMRKAVPGESRSFFPGFVFLMLHAHVNF